MKKHILSNESLVKAIRVRVLKMVYYNKGSGDNESL